MRNAIVALVIGFVVVMLPAEGGARDFLEKSAPSEIPRDYFAADVRQGALLYDDWIAAKGAKVDGANPAYPSAGAQTGAATWRCSECHGWDYLGKEGRYARGAHATGTGGVFSARKKAPSEIFAALTDETGNHDFSPYLDTDDLWALTKFIREGLVDMRLIVAEDESARGSAEDGKALYEEHCAACHGLEGNKVDLKGTKQCVEGIGWVLNDDPPKSLHRIRWGHPGSNKPSMVADKRLSVSKVSDIVAYAKSLTYTEKCEAITVVERGTPAKQTGQTGGVMAIEGELQYAEAALKAAFTAVWEKTKELDEADKAALALPTLEIAERDFLKYRMAHCSWSAAVRPGKQAEKECLLRLTRERAKELREYVAE